MTKIYDIAIIGAGIAGASLAARLAADFDVALLDGEVQAGYHSTGRSAAVLLHNYGNEVIRSLTAESINGFADIENQLTDGLKILTPRGLLQIAMADEEEALQKAIEAGTNISPLSPTDIKAMIPIIKMDGLVGGFYEPEAQDIDVDALLNHHIKMLKSLGGDLYLSYQIHDCQYNDDHWCLKDKHIEVRAKIIVNAAGAWADEIALMAGAKPLHITPKRRSMAVVPAPPMIDKDEFAKWPLFGSVSERFYAKPQSGKLLISPAEEEDINPFDAFADDMVLAEGIARFQDYVDYEITKLEHSWAGLRSFAPDRSPVCGFDKEIAGFFWLAGQGGYGVQTSPALAIRASAQITAYYMSGHSHQPDHLDHALSPLRF